MITPLSALARLADPPLDPSGDDARSLLRRELVRPEYNDTNVVERIRHWVARLFDDSVGAARDIPALPTFAAIVIGLLLALGLGLLLSRARRTARARTRRTPVLSGEVIDASALRDRAEAALVEGRFDDALVDAFRAVAVRQVERGRIEDRPQATAHEISVQLGIEFPVQRPLVERCADLFDRVRYGDHPASREQAVEVLALDDQLAGRRERVR